MTAPERLIILDVDHTLLHSYAVETILDWLPPEDTKRTIEERAKYKTTLLEQVHGAWECNDFLVCPRPHLARLESFILSQQNLSVAFYSTAAPIYLETVLPRVVPKLYDKAKFVWGKDKCQLYKEIKYKIHPMASLLSGGGRYREIKIRIKDIATVCGQVGIALDQIFMVDDLPTVTPWFSWLEISPFNIAQGIGPAHQDYQLLRLIKRLQLLLDQPKGTYALRMHEITQIRNWENFRNYSLLLHKRNGLTEENYPIARPLPYDHVPDTLEAVKDLLA